MEAVVLAGGRGSRLGAATNTTPKPMMPVHGRPFLEYLLHYWQTQGVKRFILSVGYLHESIENHFGGQFQGAELAYSVEEKALGTGGGMLLASQKVAGRHFVLINGDTFFEAELAQLAGHHERHKADMTLALFETHSSSRYESVVLAADGRIQSFQPRGTAAAAGLVNGGVYLIEKSLLALLLTDPVRTCSLEAVLLPQFLKQGRRLFGTACQGRFLDIGIPEDYEKAAALLKREECGGGTSHRQPSENA